MSHNFYDPDDPTESGRPHSPHPQNSGQQGKLVLGSFQDQPQQNQKRPYQYPQEPPRTPQQRQNYGAQQKQQTQQAYPNTRGTVATPNLPVYPQVPGQYKGGSRPAHKSPRRKRRLGGLITLAIVALLLIFTGTTLQRVMAFGSTISTQKQPLSSQTGYMGGSDRTNLLVLGYGGGTHEGGNLTDSLVVVSTLPQNHHTSLISVPRDLWVQYPPQSGQYTKINALYEAGSNNGKDPATGGDAVAQKVAFVTGIDVKYWITIDFNGFRDLINSIGGIDVYVPDSFTSDYPKNDDPNVDASWISIHFDKGNQHMDGETAIRYARARHATDNLAEGTDFARSARQQIIIKATLAKVKQMSTWPSLFSAMDALQHTIYTNLSLADLMEFATKMDLNDQKTAHIGLSNTNVLQDGNAGQYILTAHNNDWNAVKAYVQQNLYN